MKKLNLLMAGGMLMLVAYGFSTNSMPEGDGKDIFIDRKCGGCHSVDSEGLASNAKKKNDLSDTGSKHTAEFMTKFLTKQESINDKKHPIAFKGSDEELQNLVNWLQSLKASE